MNVSELCNEFLKSRQQFSGWSFGVTMIWQTTSHQTGFLETGFWQIDFQSCLLGNSVIWKIDFWQIGFLQIDFFGKLAFLQHCVPHLSTWRFPLVLWLLDLWCFVPLWENQRGRVIFVSVYACIPSSKHSIWHLVSAWWTFVVQKKNNTSLQNRMEWKWTRATTNWVFITKIYRT